MVTTTKATPTATVQPLTQGPIHCHNEFDNEYTKHEDVNPDTQDPYSQVFMQLNHDTVGPNDEPFYFRYHKSNSLTYAYRAEWVKGCVTTVEKQDFHFPLGRTLTEVSAYTLMRQNYLSCELSLFSLFGSIKYLIWAFKNGGKTERKGEKKKKKKRTNASMSTGNNHGVGGWTQAGCVKYDFAPSVWSTIP